MVTNDNSSMLEWLQATAAAVLHNLAGLNTPGSRIYIPYLLAAIMLAALAYYVNRKRLGPNAKGGVLKYIFNPKVFFNSSSLVDVKLILAGRLLRPLMMLCGSAAIALSAGFVASAILGANTEPLAPAHNMALLIFATLAITIASDFTTYWVHRGHHESTLLWPFHKVHHSAEALTPLTLLRKHPVYDLTRATANIFLVGPVQGVIFAVFGINSIVTILGANAVYALFNWAGSNLRHSHIWLSYGPVWSRIFISPSQHQIHHSVAIEHHDKNYGEILALWDWMFGTLYTPKCYEQLNFGVADAAGQPMAQPHPTLKAAWLAPFSEFAAEWRALPAKGSTANEAPTASRSARS